MASQLAHFHQRDHIFLSYELVHLRKQYVNTTTTVRRGVRLFGRCNDLDKDEELKDHNVCGILVNILSLLRCTQHCQSSKLDQSYSGDIATFLQLDSVRLYFRDSNYWHTTHALSRDARVPEHYPEMFDGDWWSENRGLGDVWRETRPHVHRGPDHDFENHTLILGPEEYLWLEQLKRSRVCPKSGPLSL
jgi:hypothetical protein